jgi:hypothetical protein
LYWDINLAAPGPTRQSFEDQWANLCNELCTFLLVRAPKLAVRMAACFSPCPFLPSRSETSLQIWIALLNQSRASFAVILRTVWKFTETIGYLQKTFKEPAKTWSSTSDGDQPSKNFKKLEDRDQPCKNMKNLEVPPLTGTNLQLQLQWFPFETSVGGEFEAMKLLTESKGHGPSKTHFFVISKPPTKPLSLKPVQNHETSLKCP